MLELSLGNVWAWAIQVAALAGAGVLLPSLLRMASPGARLLHFRALLLVCLALPLLQPWVTTPVTPVPEAAVAPADLPAGDGAGDVSDGASGTGAAVEAWFSRSLGARRWPADVIVGAVYLAGLTFRLFWLGLGLWSLSRLRSSAVPLEPRPGPVDDAALLVGADAEFLVSPRVVRPVTFGIRRPVVLVPPGFSAFALEQQTAVAAHELLHVARRDWIRTLGDELILSALWFHPVLWWLVEQIRLSTEQLVDREVVRLVGARKPYLEALLKLAASGPTPMLQPASLFLKHGHLAQRVALLVREVSMSRVRLVSSFVLVLAVLSAGGWYIVQAFPLTSIVETVAATLPTPPVAVAGPVEPPPASFKPGVDEAVGQQAKPTVPPNAQTAQPGPVPMPKVPAPPPAPPLPAPGMKAVVNLPPEPFDPVAWEKKVQAVITRTGVMPSDPTLPYTLGALYWERAYRDTGLTVAQKEFYLQKGFEALDRALALKPEYVDALIYKNLLLRSRASLETDPAKQEQLMLEADKLRDQALKLKQARDAWDAVPANAVRVGGGVAPPTKIRNVNPVYPADALAARVAGVVILEAVIGPDGKVINARVLRSIPLLDQAALDAVRQWEFTPTLLNGTAVPVVMTATVNFMPKDGAGAAGGVGGGLVAPPPPPPPPPPGEKGLSDPAAVRVGGSISPPTRITSVNPVYPPEARDARVQGVVILDILIGEDGRVEKAKILRSIPMLDQAAQDAVAQWVFTPTTVNGEAKKVIMTVTVNFTLQ